MIFKPVDNIALRDRNNKSVFLAGSIEMGKAEDWQEIVSQFYDMEGWDVFNPRRDDWDVSWEQDFNNPQFSQQVNWELNALKHADKILMHFCPGTNSPITLLELGLYAGSGKITVSCPPGFYRKGNVDIVCNIYDIPLFCDENFIEQFKIGYK